MKGTKTKKSNNLEYYLGLPYGMKFISEEAGGYSAVIDELEGCMSQGETLKEAKENLEDAKKLWLEVALEKKIEIPLPESLREHSGRFVVRVPKYLHQRLASLAKRENISLNQLVVSLLSERSMIKENINTIRKEIKNGIRDAELLVWKPEIEYREIYKDTEKLLTLVVSKADYFKFGSGKRKITQQRWEATD